MASVTTPRLSQEQADEIIRQVLDSNPLARPGTIVARLVEAGGSRRTGYRQVERYLRACRPFDAVPDLSERVNRMARLIERLLEQHARGERQGSPAALIRVYLDLPTTGGTRTAAKLRTADDSLTDHAETEAEAQARRDLIDQLLATE